MPRTMTSKERVKAAFAHNPVDRVPMMILLGETWMIEREKISFKDLREMDDLGAELIVRTYDEMQSDSVTTGLGCLRLSVAPPRSQRSAPRSRLNPASTTLRRISLPWIARKSVKGWRTVN